MLDENSIIALPRAFIPPFISILFPGTLSGAPDINMPPVRLSTWHRQLSDDGFN